jgi:general secretion pathway protein B
MSYILDALKKAESERILGSVPNVHAQPVPLTAIDRGSSWWRRPLAWTVPALALAAGVLTWTEPWETAPAVAAITPSPTQTALPAAPSTSSAILSPVRPAPPERPAAGVSVAAQAPLIPAAPPPIEAPAPRKAVPAGPGTPRTVPKRANKPVEKDSARLAASPEPQPAGKIGLASAAARSDDNGVSLRELPSNIQREIPPLTIGGYIYAGNPAERSVLINNRLLREGDQIAAGLTLEKMMPREAVLNYRGYRYRVPY